MPRGDGTGPAGMGPMSGRAAGYCAGYPVPGFANPFAGRGYGVGFGRGFGGRGFGRRFMGYSAGFPVYPGFGGYVPAAGFPVAHPTQDPEMEKQALKYRADALQAELDGIQARIADLEKGTPDR